MARNRPTGLTCEVRSNMLRYMVVSALAVFVVQVAKADRDGIRTSGKWKLPRVEQVDPFSMSVSVNGRYVAYLGGPKVDFRRPQTLPRVAWLVDTSSGEVINLSKRVAKMQGMEGDVLWASLSPNGRYVALRLGDPTRTGSRDTFWLYATSDGTLRKVNERFPFSLAWVGDRLAVNRFNSAPLGPAEKSDGNAALVLRARLVDPNSGSSTELPIPGLVDSADPNGRLMSVSLIASDRQMAWPPVGVEGANVVVMEVDGRIIGSLGTTLTVYGSPLFSASGRFIAFQHTRWDFSGERPSCAARVDIHRADGGRIRSARGASTPVGVTDDGSVLALDVTSMGNEGAPVTLHLSTGRPRILVKAAWEARLVGKRLFYITGNQERILRMITLPPKHEQNALPEWRLQTPIPPSRQRPLLAPIQRNPGCAGPSRFGRHLFGCFGEALRCRTGLFGRRVEGSGGSQGS